MAFIHRAVVLQCIYISIKRCVSFIFPSLLGTNYTIASPIINSCLYENMCCFLKFFGQKHDCLMQYMASHKSLFYMDYFFF